VPGQHTMISSAAGTSTQSPSSGNMTLLSLAGNGVPSWP
jgi:hypothetical protein